MKDLAEQAGDSVGTASNAMAGRGGPSAETVAHVAEVARRIGYVTNAAARSLRSRRSRLVACLVPDIANRFYGVIVRAAEHVLREAAYTLLLVDTKTTPSRCSTLPASASTACCLLPAPRARPGCSIRSRKSMRR
ncbi:LacI family DNA-binding transcriptional regulator [Cupriavidus basilensis]